MTEGLAVGLALLALDFGRMLLPTVSLGRSYELPEVTGTPSDRRGPIPATKAVSPDRRDSPQTDAQALLRVGVGEPVPRRPALDLEQHRLDHEPPAVRQRGATDRSPARHRQIRRGRNR